MEICALLVDTCANQNIDCCFWGIMAVSPLVLFVLCSLLSSLASGQHIVRVETKTANADGAQMNFAQINLRIFAKNLVDSCLIENLDSAGNNFQQGELDVFTGIDLQGCDHFHTPNRTVNRIQISHM